MRFSVSAATVHAVTGSSDPEIMQDGRDVSGSAIGHLLLLLEEQRDTLGIEHYSVSPTTLDQVFLNVVGQHNVQEENYGGPKQSRFRQRFPLFF
jgi:hypothetical protein